MRLCVRLYARRARAAGERICDLGASLRFAQRGFFDLLPDFLMTQVPVFTMSWEAVWCTEYHGIVPKVVPACTGGTWVLYLEGIINYPLPIWDDSASAHPKLCF